VFKSSRYADLSLNQWLALTPPDLLKVHLNLGPEFADALRKTKAPIVPA
jgi:oxalate decarboxylase